MPCRVRRLMPICSKRFWTASRLNRTTGAKFGKTRASWGRASLRAKHHRPSGERCRTWTSPNATSPRRRIWIRYTRSTQPSSGTVTKAGWPSPSDVDGVPSNSHSLRDRPPSARTRNVISVHTPCAYVSGASRSTTTGRRQPGSSNSISARTPTIPPKAMPTVLRLGTKAVTSPRPSQRMARWMRGAPGLNGAEPPRRPGSTRAPRRPSDLRVAVRVPGRRDGASTAGPCA